MSFMELERMVFNSAAYREILCSDGMRNLVEDATGMMAAEVGESAPYYTQNPILQVVGSVNAGGSLLTPPVRMACGRSLRRLSCVLWRRWQQVVDSDRAQSRQNLCYSC